MRDYGEVQQLKAPCIEHGPPTGTSRDAAGLLMFMAGCIYNDTPEWGAGMDKFTSKSMTVARNKIQMGGIFRKSSRLLAVASRKSKSQAC